MYGDSFDPDRNDVEKLQRRAAFGDETAMDLLRRHYPMYVRDPVACREFYRRADRAAREARDG